MRRPLPLRPTLGPRETILSFLSRLAEVNGTGAKDFAVDMAISYKRLLNLEEEPLDALGDCAALDSAAMEALISWTGRRIGDVRMKFRGEVVVSRSIRNPTMRG